MSTGLASGVCGKCYLRNPPKMQEQLRQKRKNLFIFSGSGVVLRR